MPDVHELTRSYETWLGARIPLLDADLDRKHAEMAGQEFRFLRGTYYLWLIRIAELLPEALAGTRLPVIGDLHVENFGTWHDREAVRRWGVNDFDELADGGCLSDLVRLATSAVLAPHFVLTDKDVCRAVYDAWTTAEPRGSVDLGEAGAGHLRALVPEAADTAEFYDQLGSAAVAEVPDQVAATAITVAAQGWSPTWHVREAGTGSLGHRRFVGVGPTPDGPLQAREAKQLGPGTASWAAGIDASAGWPTPDEALFDRVREAIHGPAAAIRVRDWQVRELAPDVVRIELAGLHRHDGERVLGAMARAAADVHGCDRGAFGVAVEEVLRLGPGGFHDAVRTMVAGTKADYRAYRG